MSPNLAEKRTCKMSFVISMNETDVDLREWVKKTCALPQNQNQSEVRVLASLVAAFFLASVGEPLFYLIFVPSSLLSQVARLSTVEYGVPAALAFSFVMTLPHLATLLFWPDKLHLAWPRKIAAWGALIAATAWLYMAALATPLDVGAVEWAYGMRVIGSLLVGGTYGISLNAQQLRDRLDAQAR